MATVIYALSDPRTKEVRYVGKTAQKPQDRLTAHVRNSKAKRTHRDCWIAGMLAAGVQPELFVLETVADDWQERERFWIRHFRRTTVALTNRTDGGDGMDSETAKAGWTPERKAAQSILTAEANRKRKGQKWSAERRALQSEAQTKRWADPVEREAARLRMTRVCASTEYRALQSKSVTAAWTPERRAAQSAVAKRVNACPERRAAQSALMASLNRQRAQQK